MVGKLLCWLGLHDWGILRYSAKQAGMYVSYCKSCGKAVHVR